MPDVDEGRIRSLQDEVRELKITIKELSKTLAASHRRIRELMDQRDQEININAHYRHEIYVLKNLLDKKSRREKPHGKSSSSATDR